MGGRSDHPRATSYDVAKLAGVAQSTVSRCFQKNSNISPETRERVLKIAAELGYTRNALARSLITRKSNMVGVIVTRLTLRNNPGLVHVLGEALRDAGKRMLMLTIEGDMAVGGIIGEALEYPLDGLICCSEMAEGDGLRFRRGNIPVVFFNRESVMDGADSVSTDHATSGAEIARRLVASGRRRMLCVAGPQDAPVSRQRVDPFMAELQRAGITDCHKVVTDFSYEAGVAALEAHAQGGGRPEAVFCANDQLALGVMDAARIRLGWQVPEDVSIVGFDDIPEAGHLGYQLTTVRQPVEEMAQQAVALLASRAQEPGLEPRRMRLPGTLIQRGSATFTA